MVLTANETDRLAGFLEDEVSKSTSKIYVWTQARIFCYINDYEATYDEIEEIIEELGNYEDIVVVIMKIYIFIIVSFI